MLCKCYCLLYLSLFFVFFTSILARRSPITLVLAQASFNSGAEHRNSNDYSLALSQYNRRASGGNPQQQTPPKVQHPREENPLVKQASVVSIFVLFILLTWRSLSAYELADQFSSRSLRIITVAPTVGILLANLIGFVLNALKPSNFKNQLKVILAVNIIREIVELLYNMFMLVITSGLAPIPREVYFGRFFMSVWWLLFLTKFSKSR